MEKEIKLLESKLRLPIHINYISEHILKKDLEETKKQFKKLQEDLEQFQELSKPEDFFRDTLTEKDLEIPILGEDQKYKKDVA